MITQLPYITPLSVMQCVSEAAIYRKTTSNIDFTTGETGEDYNILLTIGSLFVDGEFKRKFFQDIMLDKDSYFGIVSGDVLVDDYIVVGIVPYVVKSVIQRLNEWSILELKYTAGTNILTQRTLEYIEFKEISSRGMYIIDWLSRQIPADYDGIIWPILGGDGLDYLFPLGESSDLDNITAFRERGRKSGFTFSDGSTALAKDLNANPDYQSVIDTVNTLLGRN